MAGRGDQGARRATTGVGAHLLASPSPSPGPNPNLPLPLTLPLPIPYPYPQPTPNPNPNQVRAYLAGREQEVMSLGGPAPAPPTTPDAASEQDPLYDMDV